MIQVESIKASQMSKIAAALHQFDWLFRIWFPYANNHTALGMLFCPETE